MKNPFMLLTTVAAVSGLVSCAKTAEQETDPYGVPIENSKIDDPYGVPQPPAPFDLPPQANVPVNPIPPLSQGGGISPYDRAGGSIPPPPSAYTPRYPSQAPQRGGQAAYPPPTYPPQQGSFPQELPAPQPQPVINAVPHTVVQGDTLWGLSRRYNTSVAAIKKANRLKNNKILKGTTLQIPQQ